MRYRIHTPGQSRRRDQQRADIRSKVAAFVEREQCITVKEIAVHLGITTQRATNALRQLVLQGEVIRLQPGFYGDVQD